jgi:SAM-dependent methyltransferase
MRANTRLVGAVKGRIGMAVSIPWYARIAAKLVLSSLPVPYGLWKRIGIYSHGEMQDADYAFGVLNFHVAASGLSGRSGLTGLEMGPGDSVASAIAAKAMGFSAFYLVDAGDFATRDVEAYTAMGETCRREGLTPPDIAGATGLDDILRACGASYLTGGLQSYRDIPAASVDLIFSQAVLEHLRRDEFMQIVAEMRRILKPGGIASHQVDLRDHLGGGLNNMRIASRWWESEFMANAGFYTNRIRFSEMCRMFEQTGFAVEVVSTTRWNSVPVAIGKLAPEFRQLDRQDLLINSFHVLLRSAGPPPKFER